MALPVSRLVNVTVNLIPLAAAGRSFGVLMIAGDSNVISGAERFRSYLTIEDVALDFGVSAPEYQAAALYFGQTPKPSTLMIGRWLRTATAGFNEGALLTPAQQDISAWTGITSGGFDITIDGTAKNLSGLDFSSVTNLNGIASVINGSLTGGVASWNGSSFVITSSSTGAGSQATGTVTFSGQPAVNDTVTIKGTAITFVASSPVGNQVVIGATTADTVANFQAFVSASMDTNLSAMTYSTTGLVTTITAKVFGTAGNAYTLAKSSSNIAVSGADLSGGTTPSSVGYATTGAGTDISALLGLTSGLSIALVGGYNAETPVQCAQALSSASTAWYGLMFQASVQPTISQNLAVCGFIEALSITRIFGVTITDTSVLSSLVSNDLASLMKAGAYNQCFCQYSQNPYAIASFFGRAFSVQFLANNSTITLMFKQEPGVTGENLVDNQADVLQSKNCNVFVDYVNSTMIIQYGVMSSGLFFDEIHGVDWFQDAVQTACYNVLYQSTTKIPQTDAGVNQLTNAIAGVCEEAVNNGFVAPGVWNAGGFGQLVPGQYLKTGYYIYAQSVNLQAQSDRAAGKAPPIQVAIKLADAIQSVDVLVNVNQ